MIKKTSSFLIVLLFAIFLIGCSSEPTKSGEQAQAGDYKTSPQAPPGKG